MDGIGRLRIVCMAESGGSARALAARSRLERIARSDLGAALDRQVADAPPVRLDSLTVRLELDPHEYEDPTLAALWASRIREVIRDAAPASAANATAAETATESSLGAPAGPGSVSPGPALLEAPVVTARRAIAGEPGGLAALAAAVVANPDGVARVLREQLSAPDRLRLLRAFGVPIGRAAAQRRSTSPSEVSPRAIPGGPAPAARRSRQARRVGAWAARLETASRRWLAATPRNLRTSVAPGRRANAAAGGRPSLTPVVEGDHVVVSRSGGVGLLWPWLTDYLEAAADRIPRLGPTAVRRLALTALVPGVAGAVDDPVVRLLAGDDVAQEPSLIVVTQGEMRRAAEGAESVLDAFASTLPGFAGSTPEFVRREFLVRPGTVEWTADPVLISLARLPLDPALTRLTYPIAAFRLPWTRPIAIRLELG